jgi:ABC-type multidrug transport system permease subunit
MIGFVPDASKFFIFIAVNIICANVGSAYGMLLGTAAKDTSVAISLQPIVLIPFIIFSGYFINSDNVPPYFIWIEYISFIKYGFHALVVNEVTQGIDL